MRAPGIGGEADTLSHDSKEVRIVFEVALAYGMEKNEPSKDKSPISSVPSVLYRTPSFQRWWSDGQDHCGVDCVLRSGDRSW